MTTAGKSNNGDLTISRGSADKLATWLHAAACSRCSQPERAPRSSAKFVLCARSIGRSLPPAAAAKLAPGMHTLYTPHRRIACATCLERQRYGTIAGIGHDNRCGIHLCSMDTTGVCSSAQDRPSAGYMPHRAQQITMTCSEVVPLIPT